MNDDGEYNCPDGGSECSDNVTEIVQNLMAELEEQRTAKNGAYSERNKLVAALSKLFPASLEPHVGEDWGPEWLWVCFIDLPGGQVSWHVMTSELSWFAHLPRNAGRVWDLHDTEEKYRRLDALDSLVNGESGELKDVEES